MTKRFARRALLRDLALAGVMWPAIARAGSRRPVIIGGVMSGDVDASGATIWSQVDRPARMLIEWSTTQRFQKARRVRGPDALPVTALTSRVRLMDLPAGQTIFYRVRYLDLSDLRTTSAPVVGKLRTPPPGGKTVTVGFSGDTCGQGFGINEDWGGLRIYKTMLKQDFDMFIHSGDLVYADGPIPGSITLDDGTQWKNVVTEAKSKVAETLEEFRGNYRYNLLDPSYRKFNSEVPLLVGWDDHETHDNWFPSRRLDDDDRYKEKSCALLAARAHRAFMEFTPTHWASPEAGRMYRKISYGPNVDVFMLDTRSYRAPNSKNDQKRVGPKTSFLGEDQLAWLYKELERSKSTWKIMSCSVPLGLVVPHGETEHEGVANGKPEALGRELEIGELLRFMKKKGIKNTLWVTADVHYAAAHHYSPQRARFTEFDPFWEIVAGPLNAGTWGPNPLDATFGPKVEFSSIPEGMKGNRPPSEAFQFFGRAQIDGRTKALTVSLHNLWGKKLWTKTLPAT